MVRLLTFLRRDPVIAVVTILGVTLFLFGPVLRGNVPLAVSSLRTIMPLETMSRADGAFLRDALVQAYPYHTFTSTMFRQGTFPLWNPLTFSGIPFFANGQAGVLSPVKALWWGFSPAVSFTLTILSQFLLGGLGLYLCAGSWGWHRASRLFAAIAFILSAPFILWSTTSIMSAVVAFLPWLLWAIHGLHRTLAWRWVIGLVILCTATIFSGQVQIALLVVLFAGVWTLVFWQRTHWQRRLALFTLAFTLGLGMAAVQLIPNVEASQLAYRQASPRTWSYLLNPKNLFHLESRNTRAFATIIEPNALGYNTAYHGPANYLEGNLYVGPLVVLLGLLSFAAWRQRLWRIAVGMVVLVCLFITFPTLKGLLIGKLIPPLSLASVWRFSFFFTFGAAVMAGAGVEWLRRKRKWIGNVAVVGLIITGLWQWQNILPFGSASELYPQSPILHDAAQQTQSRMWAKDSDLDQYMPYGIPTVLGYDSFYPQLYLDLWRTNSELVKKNQLVIRNPHMNVLAVTGVDSLLTLQPLPTGWHKVATQGPWTLAKPDTQPKPIHAVQQLLATTRPSAIQEINVQTQALVAGTPPDIDPNATATVHVQKQSATTLVLNVETSGNTVVVTNLQFYPGWYVRIDEKKSKPLQVNSTFLGAAVPVGTHTVTFSYEPRSLAIGGFVSAGAIIVLITGYFLERRRKKSNQQ